MSAETKFNSMTITGHGRFSQVDTVLQRQEGDRREAVSLSVVIPSEPGLSVVDAQQRAVKRAIELLQNALPENRQSAETD